MSNLDSEKELSSAKVPSLVELPGLGEVPSSTEVPGLAEVPSSLNLPPKRADSSQNGPLCTRPFIIITTRLALCLVVGCSSK